MKYERVREMLSQVQETVALTAPDFMTNMKVSAHPLCHVYVVSVVSPLSLFMNMLSFSVHTSFHA